MKVATRRGARPGRERPFSPGYLVVFDYDEVGNRTRLALNTGGTVVHYYAYDAISQMTSLQSANTDNNSFDENTYEYNEVGQKAKQAHTNDSTSYFEFDDASRLAAQKTLKSTDGSTLASLTYTRDASGRITQIDKPAGAAGYFQYDRASRVTVDHRWESGVAAQIDYYHYDAAGNRIHRHTFGGAAQNSYYFYDDGDRVTCVHDIDAPSHEYFHYDEAGRIIQRTGIASADPQYYFYDQEARTTSIRSKTATQETFAWDSTGMKRQQGTDDYVFDGANLLSVTDSGGTLDKASGYGPQIAPGVGGLDYQYEDGTGVPVHLEDQVGTGGLVLDSDEAEVTDYNFKSPDLSTFGEGEISAIADGSRVLSEKQFVNPSVGAGERAVGVYDFGARLYDPTLGIFLVPDPLVTGIGVVGLGVGDIFAGYTDSLRKFDDQMLVNALSARRRWRFFPEIGSPLHASMSLAENLPETPYAYSSPNPINNADPVGLVVVTITGFLAGGLFDKNDSGLRIFQDSPLGKAATASDGPVIGILEWTEADEPTDPKTGAIIDEIRKDPCKRVIIMGFSLGGDTALKLARILGDKGICVDLLVTVEPIGGDANRNVIPPNVRSAVNFLSSHNHIDLKGEHLEGAQNIKVFGVSHDYSDNDQRVHLMISRAISNLPAVGCNCPKSACGCPTVSQAWPSHPVSGRRIFYEGRLQTLNEMGCINVEFSRK